MNGERFHGYGKKAIGIGAGLLLAIGVIEFTQHIQQQGVDAALALDPSCGKLESTRFTGTSSSSFLPLSEQINAVNTGSCVDVFSEPDAQTDAKILGHIGVGEAFTVICRVKGDQENEWRVGLTNGVVGDIALTPQAAQATTNDASMFRELLLTGNTCF